MLPRTTAAAVVLKLSLDHFQKQDHVPVPHNPSTSSDGLLASLALPNTDGSALNAVLKFIKHLNR